MTVSNPANATAWYPYGIDCIFLELTTLVHVLHTYGVTGL